MNRFFSLFNVLTFAFTFLCSSLLAQSPDIEWQKCLGGSKEDRIYCIEQTKDGGFIAAGSTLSVDGDLNSNKGIKGAWLVKLHSDGSIDWEKTYLSDSLGKIRNVRQTADGGYVAIGDKTIKVDANGNVLWVVGVKGFDILQSKDSVYVACGDTLTATDEILVRKFDSAGNIFWNFIYDGGQATSIKETSDGYIFTGFYNYDITSYGVLGKLNVDGDEIYVKDEDAGGINDVALTRDGNYVFAGWNSTAANIKLIDPTGSLIWQASDSLTGSILSSIRQTTNGYVTCGQGHLTSGSSDMVYVRNYDSAGNVIWKKLLGGSNNNIGNCIRQTTDGGFIIAGYTNSTDGDVKGNHGGYDGWIVKLKGSTGIKDILQNSSIIQVYPTVTKSVVNILLLDNKNASMVLLNSLGQRVNAEHFSTPYNTIDLSNYSNGLYILQIYSNNNMQSYKIIKK